MLSHSTCCAWEQVKCFIRNTSTSSLSNCILLMKYVLLLPLLYRWRNRGIERLSNRPRISQVLKCKPRFCRLQGKSMKPWAEQQVSTNPVFQISDLNQQQLFQYHVLVLSSNPCWLLDRGQSHVTEWYPVEEQTYWENFRTNGLSILIKAFRYDAGHCSHNLWVFPQLETGKQTKEGIMRCKSAKAEEGAMKHLDAIC